MEITLKHSQADVLKRAFAVAFYVLIFALVVPSFFYLLGKSLDGIVNPFNQIPISLVLPGVILLSIGGCFIIGAVFELGKFGRGLPASPVPPTFLVTDGLYGLSRHPVYFGASLSYLGTSLSLHSFWNTLLCWPLFTLFFISYALRIEEPVLEKRFGWEYRVYRENVPMFWEFPFRKTSIRITGCFFSWISAGINRPFILKYRKHHFFLGYGLWVGFGVFVGLTALNMILLADKISASEIGGLIAFFTVSSLLGSRFVSITVYMVLEKLGIKKAWYRVGFVSWGVMAAAFLSSGMFFVLARQSLYIWFDAAFTCLMITHFFGRIGCLFYGCCYGKENHSSIHISYSHPTMKVVREGRVRAKSLYPIQLYSALYGLITFLIVISLWSTTSLTIGVPAVVCIILYGTFRFIEEWFRFQKRLIAGVFSPAQLISLVLILLGALHLGWILPSINPGTYQQLRLLFSKELLSQLSILLLITMGLLTTFVFSYHRYEIGLWGRRGSPHNLKRG